MSKTLYINEKQYEQLRESIENNNKIDSLSFLLSNVPFDGISENSIKNILLGGYDETVGCFSDDITSFSRDIVVSKLNKLISICQKKEEPIREQLEKLCSDLVTSIFKIGGIEMQLSVNLIREVSKGKSFHISASSDGGYEYDSIDSRDKLALEEEKRKYINALMIGASLSLTETLLKNSLSEIFELDEELPHLYSKIVKINNYLLYTSNTRPTDEDSLQGAYEDVLFSRENNDVKIEVNGLIFPFLLTEAIRAFIEVLSVKTLPESTNEANLIIGNCDTLENEPFYMTFGKSLWDRINIDNKIEPDTIEKFFDSIFEIDTTEFNSLMREVIEGTKLGKNEIANIINQVNRESEYQSFEKDLQAKRDEQNLIVDEYISEDELLEDTLEEANYPSNFNLEEFKQLNSFRAREKYCRERLKYLGKGSSRVVFQIDDATVLKLAYNNKGIAQNEADARVKNDQYLQGYNFLPEVYDVDENYLWIEMQTARKARKSDFKRLTGYNWDVFYYWVMNCWNRSVAHRSEVRHIPDEYRILFQSRNWMNELESYSLFAEIEDYIGNYDVQGWGDLATIQNWGVSVGKDGVENLVLVDNGLDNDVLDKYYR